MTIDLPALVTAVGSVMLIVGTLLSQHATRRREANTRDRDDLEDRDLQLLAARRHIRRLEDVVSALDGEVPPRPAELTPGWTRKSRKEVAAGDAPAE